VAILADKKSGMLLVDAQDKDPEFAAQLANAQVKELNVILSRLAVTEAQQRRVYYEQQIIKTQTKIPQLELEYKEAQKSSGLELASLLSEAGTLPGQIAAKELQLQVLSRFATAQNPDLKRLAVEISALRAQMAKYELSKTDPKTSELSKPGQMAESTKSNFVQKATQSYNTLKIQEALLDGYVKQLELAKVDEAKEGPAVQVVDEARAPEMRAKPERKKLVLAYTVTGLIIAFVLAAFRALLRHIRSTPEGLQRWSQLKRAWGFA
jgi:tyrosine-protein kinase Etk/Wzc